MSELRWLAFDTSTDVLSLAVARGDRVWTQTLPGGAQSSSGLIPAVLGLLAEADMPLASLTAIVFGRGPGSFTGLRTACAVAQGLAFGANIPVLPVDTLLAVAEEARWQRVQAGAADTDVSVLALLDARMDEVYSAAYQWTAASQSWQGLSALQVSAPQQVQFTADVLAGNVFEAYGPRLLAQGERCVALPTAAALLRLAPTFWAQGQAVPAEQAMPLYIRDKVANTTAEREAMKAQAVLAKVAQAPTAP
jgi:tRNA threonylcarbamoyladenosine biosynthesis protein TsaB